MNKIVGLLLGLILSQTTFASVRGFNSSNVDLGHFTDIKCSTGLTCTKSGGKLNMVSSPTLTGPLTLESGEIMNNTVDDTIEFISDDENTILQVTGFEAKTAALNLWADQGDDSADKFSLSVSTSDVLAIKNNATSLLSFSSAGVQTLADSETLTNASDVISLGFDDAAAELKLVAFEATDSSLTLQADESDDSGDDWKISSVASGNALTIANDASGSQVTKFSMAATDGDITLTGGITGDGGDTLSGFLRAQVASTTTTLTAAQCGSSIISNSADVVTLPEASTVLGCRYTLICGTADDFDVNPADGTDSFSVINSVAAGTGAAITPSAGDAIRCTDIGSSITIEAVGADLWAAIGVGNGAWTDVN